MRSGHPCRINGPLTHITTQLVTRDSPISLLSARGTGGSKTVKPLYGAVLLCLGLKCICLSKTFFFFFRRPPSHLEEKPVASVRPVQSTPIPMMPRQVPMGIPSSSAGFPVNYLQKAGVYVQRVVTTTGTDLSLVVHATSCYVCGLSVCFFMVFMSLLFQIL